MVGFLKKIIQKKPHLKENTNLIEKFTEIYSKNIFGGKESRSGEGSNMIQSAEIRREIPILLQKFNIRTFIDAPCGDWFWMKQTHLGVKQYTGIDIVKALIEKNQQEFGNESINFICLNLVNEQLPQADLIFSRDCLVHLTFNDALKVIANFKQSGSTYLLTTTFTDRINNIDLRGNDFWRPINLELSPFSFPKPVALINEKCTEYHGQYSDKSLGLWPLDQIELQTY
ncbi:MAG: class I SAM-dependent methyltransferase [Desulfobacula sp.]|nr:class I SAM-dependent methyltransferase [Desulfobacula sp.]